MAQTKGKLTQEVPKHRILREVFRHYLEYRQYVSDHGKHVIEHGYFIYDEEGNHQLNADGTKRKVMVAISFWDLFNGLKELSPRKREAMWYNVILDQKQHVVAKKMGITTVSVGQYVEQACLQLAERYFAEENNESVESQDERNGLDPQPLQPPTQHVSQHPTTNGSRPQKSNLGRTEKSLGRKEKVVSGNVA